MTHSPAASWTRLAFDSWALSMEASCVVWLRGMRMMGGGAIATREAERMVAEKVEAGLGLWPVLTRGGFNQSPQELGALTLRHYAGPVRANRRRLSRA